MAYQQLRNVCFTLFVENTEPLNISTHANAQQLVQYYVYQFERTPDTNRLHAQGFLQLSDKMRLRRIKREIFHSDTIHIQGRYKKSTNEEARDYCMKEDTREPNTEPVEWGELRSSDHQGVRSDLLDARDAINEGISMKHFRQEYVTIAARYPQYARALANDREEEQCRFELRDVRVIVYWGEPGCGKTYRVMKEVCDKFGSMAQVYVVEHSSPLWFDGYEGQPCMLYDDFSSEWSTVLPITRLLRLIDRYPCRLNQKGMHAWCSAKEIYFTSNHHPNCWYPDATIEHRAALMRRIHVIDLINKPENGWNENEPLFPPGNPELP